MIQRALLVAAAAAALSVQAATTYRIEREAPKPEPAATVIVDGDRIRIDYAPVEGPVEADAMYSTDGGRTFIALNSGMRTWFRSKPRGPFTPVSGRIGGNAKARRIKWSWREEPGAEAGSHLYVGSLDYTHVEEMMGSGVPSHCTARVEIRTSEAVDARWLGELPFRIGIADIDTKLAASGATIKGLPLSIAFTTTQQYDRGPLLKDERTMTVRDVATVKSVDPKLFETPKGYRYEEPVIAAPGVLSR